MSINIDGKDVAPALAEALAKVDGATGELALDFSSVRRIDAAALHALEKLAGAASAKSVTVSLRGVNVDVYKALKLAKVAQRLSFPA